MRRTNACGFEAMNQIFYGQEMIAQASSTTLPRGRDEIINEYTQKVRLLWHDGVFSDVASFLMAMMRIASGTNTSL